MGTNKATSVTTTNPALNFCLQAITRRGCGSAAQTTDTSGDGPGFLQVIALRGANLRRQQLKMFLMTRCVLMILQLNLSAQLKSRSFKRYPWGNTQSQALSLKIVWPLFSFQRWTIKHDLQEIFRPLSKWANNQRLQFCCSILTFVRP